MRNAEFDGFTGLVEGFQAFGEEAFHALLALAKKGIGELSLLQQQALA